MSKLSVWIRTSAMKIAQGVRRFPVAIGAAAAIMVFSLVLVHNDAGLSTSVKDWLTRLCLTLGLGIPLSVSLRLIYERIGVKNHFLRGAGWALLAILLALYVLFLLPITQHPVPLYRYLAFLLSAIALIPVVPYALNRQGDERFALKLLFRLLITGVFTGILIGGLELVLAMIENLLKVTLWNQAYLDVAIVCLGLFTPMFLLTGVPQEASDFAEERFQPLARVLFGYIAFPLLAAYTAIIYIYFVQMLLRWNWPSNMLVNMVLWYTAIGVLCLYFMRTQSNANKWFRFFDTWYPRLTVLPIALMFTGLFIRIGAYGFTESRCFVLILGLWVLAATAIMILKKPDNRRNVLILTLLAVLAVLSVAGPWSAFAVSRASQNARLESLLARNGMLENNKIIPNKGVSMGDKREITSILNYFNNVQGLDRVRVLPKGTQQSNLDALLGFDASSFEGSNNSWKSIQADSNSNAIDIAGFDTLLSCNSYATTKATANGATIEVSNESVFTITRDGKTIYQKDLKEYIKLLQDTAGDGVQLPLEKLTFSDENDSVMTKFIITQASIQTNEGSVTYTADAFYALIRWK